MPDMKYFHTSGRLGHVVKDSVRTENDLSQRTSHASRICRADQRKRAKNANVVQNTAPHPLRRLGVTPSDVGADVPEVCNCSIRPDYLEVHAVAQDATSCSTSSWLFERPAAMSERPRRIDAMICNSSVISSSEAPSGSLPNASITACLSVMGKAYRIQVPKASHRPACKSSASISGVKFGMFR